MGVLPTLKLMLFVCFGWLLAAQVGKLFGLPVVSAIVALLIGYFIGKSKSLCQLNEQNRAIFSSFLGPKGYSTLGLLAVSGGLLMAIAVVVAALFSDLGNDQYTFIGMFGLMPTIFISQLTTLMATKAEDSSQ
ncbi:hypothetical protein QWY75_03330 [Pontixanthobacter aestiaquae]|uniref:Uncharacterized protein n=1 Tax=Pontixanthobacter aestiaquae TaxID=1509367 RepID=A0A844Z525_9SPHN|nr:hypothetical protein [Pontixanthobacter aestiaquae]MDN3645237.1 hypothetical protein [Pontixanthobacter aestiaquae]MXO83761.1 hypothetical protein [Pontixanthobacter aestiaquae]